MTTDNQITCCCGSVADTVKRVGELTSNIGYSTICNSVIGNMSNVFLLMPGLEFDGGTAAICRRALPTGRNSS